MIRLVLLALGLFIGALWLTAPSEADIQRCAKVSNYSLERCRFELTR